MHIVSSTQVLELPDNILAGYGNAGIEVATVCYDGTVWDAVIFWDPQLSLRSIPGDVL